MIQGEYKIQQSHINNNNIHHTQQEQHYNIDKMYQINTGNITQKCRNSCLNRINFLTILLSILIYTGSAYMVQIPDIAYYVLQVAVSYYLVLLGIMVTKPHFYVQFMQHNNNNNSIYGIPADNYGENIQIQGYRVHTATVRKKQQSNTVNIGQSFHKLYTIIIRNIKVFVLIAVIQILVLMAMNHIITQVTQGQVKMYSKILGKVQKGISSNYNSQQQYQQMFYFQLISQIQKLDGTLLHDFYRYSILIILTLLLNMIINYILVCMKLSIFSQLYPYTCSQLQDKPIEVTLLKTWQLMYRTCFRFTVICAYVRLMLRLAWIFLFFDMFMPYYYLCMAEMHWVCCQPYIKLEILQNFLKKITKKHTTTETNKDKAVVNETQASTERNKMKQQQVIKANQGITRHLPNPQHINNNVMKSEQINQIQKHEPVHPSSEIQNSQQQKHPSQQQNPNPSAQHEQSNNIIQQQQQQPIIQKPVPQVFSVKSVLQAMQINYTMMYKAQRERQKLQRQAAQRNRIYQRNRKITRFIYLPYYDQAIQVSRF